MSRYPAEDSVRVALGRVFAGVASLREDSPLSALGMQAADLVCLAEAIWTETGLLIDDSDLAGIVTLGDLQGVVNAKAQKTSGIGG